MSFRKRAKKMAADADLQLLRRMEQILERPDCDAQTRAKAEEIVQALRWWIQTGRIGNRVPRQEGKLAIEGIIEAWKMSQR